MTVSHIAPAARSAAVAAQRSTLRARFGRRAYGLVTKRIYDTLINGLGSPFELIEKE